MPASASITYGARSTGSGSIWGETIRACLCLMAFAVLLPVLYARRPKMARTGLTGETLAILTNHARRIRLWRETSTSDQRTTTPTKERL